MLTILSQPLTYSDSQALQFVLSLGGETVTLVETQALQLFS